MSNKMTRQEIEEQRAKLEAWLNSTKDPKSPEIEVRQDPDNPTVFTFTYWIRPVLPVDLSLAEPYYKALETQDD